MASRTPSGTLAATAAIAPVTGAPEATKFWRDSVALMFGTALVGVANYGLALALVWILPAAQFSEVASTNSLVLVLSTAAVAALPWVVTRAVVRSGADSATRRHTVTVTLVVAAAAGVCGGALLAALAHRYASADVMAAAAVTVVLIFVSQVGNGYLQGKGFFVLLSCFLVIEVILRVGLGAALAAVLGALGAFVGAAAGAAVLTVVTLWIARADIGRSHGWLAPYPWVQMGGIGGVQLGVAALTLLDVIVGSLIHGASPGMAGYQAMLVFTRIPLFLTTAISCVIYARLVGEPGAALRDRLTARAALGFGVLVVPLSAAVATLPAALLSVVLPQHYTDSMRLLLPLAIAGIACGWVNLVTTFYQAESHFRFPIIVLWCALPVAAAVESVVGGSLSSLAWTAAAVDSAVALIFVIAHGRHYRGARLVTVFSAAVVATAVAITILHFAGPKPSIWIPTALVITAAAATAGLMRFRAEEVAMKGRLIPDKMLGSRS